MWTKEKIELLIESYPDKGGRYCSELLGLGIRQVSSKVQNLNLSRTPPLVLSDFSNVQTPEVAYILGLLWADGYIQKPYTTNIECVSDDMVIFKPIFDSIGKWSDYTRVRSHRPVTKLTLSDKSLVTLLSSFDYNSKSIISPDKVINSIPENLQHYWFRGLVDGDGCFYYNPKHYIRHFVISSSYNQDWSYFELLCVKLNVRYKIIQKKTSKGNHSLIRVSDRKSIQHLGEYIYDGISLGLPRKKDKYLEIIK